MIRSASFRNVTLSVIFFIASLVSVPAFAQEKTFLEDFTDGLSSEWEIRDLDRRANQFSIARENGNRILRVYSSSSASGIFREWRIEPLNKGMISWRWKVNGSLEKNDRERTKAGDDFAARVFLLFEPHFFRWRTPTICYVWAGNEPAGSVFQSPHTGSVCTIVLQSGNQNAMRWVQEERDFVADYVKCFGEAPEELSAIAIMADTDDTRSEGVASFDDLMLTVNER